MNDYIKEIKHVLRFCHLPTQQAVEALVINAIERAKKEMLDDIDILIGYKELKDRQDRLNELKLRHLSTFAEGKSDIITVNIQ